MSTTVAMHSGVPASLPRSSRRASRLLEASFSFPVCVASAFAVLVYSMVPQSVADPDVWWHLRNAEWQLQSHAFLTRDLFSFTARGAAWIDHEWLAELPFYLGWRLGGNLGLFLVTLAAIELIFLGVFYLAYHKSASTMAALAVSIVAALLSTVSFGPRTLLFGWICLVAELLLLEHFPAHPRTAFLLPPLFAIWVNAHGSWLIGLILLVVSLLGGWREIHAGCIRNSAWPLEQRKILLIAACLSVCALFANPYGWRLVAYPFDLAFRQKLNIANIEEWRTLDFHSPRGRLFFACLATLFLAQLLRRPRWTLTHLCFLAIGIYSALVYSRFLFLAALLVLPLMAPLIAGAPARRPRPPTPALNKPWANALLLLLLLPLIVKHLPSRTRLDGSGEDKFPLQAAAYLRRLPARGYVFNDFSWGGFLIWNTRQMPVFIDSRVDIFEYNGVFGDYLEAVRLKNTLAILDKYHIHYVVFRKDAPLIYLLEHTAAWKIDYEDETTAVLERL